MDGLLSGRWLLTEPQDMCKVIPALKGSSLFSPQPETFPKPSYNMRKMKDRWCHQALCENPVVGTVPREPNAGQAHMGARDDEDMRRELGLTGAARTGREEGARCFREAEGGREI